jgi:hypothetical protein
MFATTFRLARRGPGGKATDAEIVALAVAQAITGTVSDRKVLGDDRLVVAVPGTRQIACRTRGLMWVGSRGRRWGLT